MHSHVVRCFLFLFFPCVFAAASTSPAPGRRPTRGAPIRTLPALSSSTATAAAAVTSAKGTVGGQMYSYTMTTPLPSRRSAGTDAARAAPGSPTHPQRSEVVAKAYEKAKATAIRELSESSSRSDHVFNELMTTTDLDTFVLACRNWHLLAWSDDVFKLLNRAHRSEIRQKVESASAGGERPGHTTRAVTESATAPATATAAAAAAAAVGAAPFDTAAVAGDIKLGSKRKASTPPDDSKSKMAAVSATRAAADIFTYATASILQSKATESKGLRFPSFHAETSRTRTGDPLLQVAASPSMYTCSSFFLLIFFFLNYFCLNVISSFHTLNHWFFFFF